MSYAEHRKYPRLPVLVDCRVEGASGRATMRLTDLSPRGCFIDTRMSLPEGTHVTVFAMFGDSEVPLTGRVIPMQSAGYGFGVEFVDLDPTSQQQLEAYIRQVSPQ